ncbi:MAG: SET domain-containing protein-lysine N-methyltransferase [Candidatus Paceibacterota bacterium]
MLKKPAVKNKKEAKVVAKRSRAGLGLFAVAPFKRGQKIIEYVGPLIPNKIAVDITNNRYLFDVNKNWTIDGRGRDNIARYANHSCKPNAESDIRGKRVFILAKKKIMPGEEITYDYGKEYFDEYIKIQNCRCDAPKHGVTD